MSAISLNPPASGTESRGRILCVDDEPNILRALSWLLQKDFEVVTAAGGDEALALVRRDDFDVVISDQRMPGMSGVDLLREVKAIAPRAMRILLTGYADVQSVLRSVNESEIFRYVAKPWSVTELPKLVAQAAAIARRHPAGAPIAGDLPAPDGKGSILVLDGDPATHALVEVAAGDVAEIVHVSNVVDAVHCLIDREFSVLVAETHLGPSIEISRFICLLKQRHPRLVAVVLAEDSATDTVARLVNQGQIYRFIPKPAKAGYLRLALRSALVKAEQLHAQGELVKRHAVDALDTEEAARLEADLALAQSLVRVSPAPSDAPPPGNRLARAWRRFFGTGRA